jgi:hypothetical protein
MSTLKVETLLLFRGAVPEVGGSVRGSRVLTGLAGQEDLLLMGHQRAVGVNESHIFHQGYGDFVTYHQILIMFALMSYPLFPPG